MAVYVNVNGRVCGEREAQVSPLDHGFLYGEGVYETLRTYNGRLFLFDRHVKRLRKSAEMIALALPVTDDELGARIRQTIAACAQGTTNQEFYVRVLLTRGVGDLSYDPAACRNPSVIVIVRPFVAPPKEVYDRGVSVALVSVIRNHPDSVNPLIKSNNLLNNALAMQEALRRGAYEGIMRNHKGELCECTQSNLFIVKNQTVLSPPLTSGILAGITRELVFEIGNQIGVRVQEEVLMDRNLYDADEAFLTSSTRELIPIVRVDEHGIGNGLPGSITRRLLAAFRDKASTLTN